MFPECSPTLSITGPLLDSVNRPFPQAFCLELSHTAARDIIHEFPREFSTIVYRDFPCNYLCDSCMTTFSVERCPAVCSVTMYRTWGYTQDSLVQFHVLFIPTIRSYIFSNRFDSSRDLTHLITICRLRFQTSIN